MLGGNKAKEAVGLMGGAEEYVYGYPLVMMDVTRQVMTAAANPANTARPSTSSRASART